MVFFFVDVVVVVVGVALPPTFWTPTSKIVTLTTGGPDLSVPRTSVVSFVFCNGKDANRAKKVILSSSMSCPITRRWNFVSNNANEDDASALEAVADDVVTRKAFA